LEMGSSKRYLIEESKLMPVTRAKLPKIYA